MKVHQKNPEGNNPKLKVHSEIHSFVPIRNILQTHRTTELQLKALSSKQKPKNVVFETWENREYIVEFLLK